jgi:hypothetical protein
MGHAGAGFTHHEWRSKVKPDAIQQPDKMTRVTDLSATTKSRKMQKAGLEAALAKLEKAAQVQPLPCVLPLLLLFEMFNYWKPQVTWLTVGCSLTIFVRSTRLCMK